MPKLIRMLWDCPACGRTGIVSTRRQCTCGYVFGTDPKDKFRMPHPDEEIVEVEDPTNADELIENWRCDFCGGYNKHSDLVCTTCGHPRDESAQSYFTVTGEEKSSRSEEMAEGDVYEGSENIYENQNLTAHEIDDAVHKKTGQKTFEEIAEESRQKEAGRKAAAAAKAEQQKAESAGYVSAEQPKKGGFLKILIILAAVIAALGFLGSYFFTPKQSNVRVSEKSWERSVQIEELKTFEENGWELPSGARLIRTAREIRGYDQVLDHYESVEVTKYRSVPHTETYYEDLGNGNAEERTRTYYTEEPYTVTEQQPVYRSVPVYGTKYYYEVDRYVYSRSVDTSGTGDDPYWGETSLNLLERESGRTETYYISFSDDSGTYRVEVPWEYWKDLSAGSEAPVEKARVGGYHFVIPDK